MASRSSRRSTAHTVRIANPRLVRLASALRFGLKPRLSLLEDRRQFHPLGPLRPALSVPRRAARVVIRRPNRAFSVPEVLGFAEPRRVAICIRRKERREVLFAKKRMRSGGGAKKRRNNWSAISCR